MFDTSFKVCFWWSKKYDYSNGIGCCGSLIQPIVWTWSCSQRPTDFQNSGFVATSIEKFIFDTFLKKFRNPDSSKSSLEPWHCSAKVECHRWYCMGLRGDWKALRQFLALTRCYGSNEAFSRLPKIIVWKQQNENASILTIPYILVHIFWRYV